ncbi:SAM-dependent methyltransferase [Pseudoclavibacter sp. AY1F1]|uniref:bifunctional PIG-L family deacetylase/class I SAM-dependent methyltransferase n=1 Tax=Pseudoclavibacter sp. AY1F1 TaxID=2080583 RepID=UPI000CE7B9D5|nr:bifunctional PIG-L family deacetylase/class I SAM-dependent methyltransferase [Pseudoclavibacter sp. AY1F1]PPF47247.1 SAM-dependent methyltransferase [Pseudoclavibacter sp. AY1F1]
MIGAAHPEFTHLQTGTAEAVWRRVDLDNLPVLDAEAPGIDFGPGTMLLVGAAHPDDECLGAAGLIVTALAAGANVTVLLCTRGEASHPASPSVSAEQLAVTRRAEFDAALRELRSSARRIAGPAGVQPGRADAMELGLRDGSLADSVAEITAAADKLIRDSDNKRVIVAAPYRRDGHPDHAAVGEALARSALDAGALLLEFPIWFWHWAEPDVDTEWRHWRRLPLSSAAVMSKSDALGAHVSQLTPLTDAAGDEPVLGKAQLEHFQRDFEVFRVTAPATRDSTSANSEFDGVHTDADDPWGLRTSWYERRKLALMLAMLPDTHASIALEIGCSIGESTAALAERSSRLIAVDASAAALRLAEARIAGTASVQLVLATLPHEWDRLEVPDGTLNLVVLSETGYYLAEDELCELLTRSRRALAPTGALVLCHWRGPIVGWPLDGDRVHALAARLGMRRLAAFAQDDTLIDVYENGEPGSGRSCFAQWRGDPSQDPTAQHMPSPRPAPRAERAVRS